MDARPPEPDDQFLTPLLSALLTHARSGRKRWHMPGHLGGLAWPEGMAENLAAIDVTELPDTDDINHPSGAARQAMDLAARAFGAGHTRLLTGGSTLALQILLALAVGRGGKLLVARTCHQAVVHAAALLDIQLCVFTQTGVSPDSVPFSLFPQATAADVVRGLAFHPGCRAVLLTSPDYYGGCADLAEVAEAVHARGACLLVDEAHGAHLAFAPGLLPPAALAAGADACVQSGHKTLPVLTGGAWLHLGQAALASGRLAAADLARLVPVFQTSSPPFPIAASLDLARQLMALCGERQIRLQLDHLEQFRLALPDWLICPVSGRGGGTLRRDPLRLVIAARDWRLAFAMPALALHLSDDGIDIEFADLTRLVLIFSLWQSPDDWQDLTESLRRFPVPDSGDLAESSAGLLELERRWVRQLAEPDRTSPVFPKDALLAPGAREFCRLDDAAGRVTAQALVPYPPGIPLVWPGDTLTPDDVDFLRRLLDNNISINGVDAGNVQVLA
ncbi:MAG: hypothetical protein M0P55_04510 [Clostridiales bacterium]|nr:hypothetical protein [Clostridiales bacterium]